ncbi:MAG TPA: hypothetical protein VKG24_00505 [Pseudolabrys sp.]|nr:hypothetical protein [Pseudolabrys sp.]
MAIKLILMGDVNLMDVTNPEEPFRKILGELHAADVVFGNLECCLHLPASRQSDANEGFFADPVVGGEALKLACIHAVGIANNVPVELYKGRPIYYGLGNLWFKTGHLGRRHENWIGMVAEVSFENGKCGSDNFRFVRHNESYETIFRRPADEVLVLADLTARSKALGATLTAEEDRVRIEL